MYKFCKFYIKVSTFLKCAAYLYFLTIAEKGTGSGLSGGENAHLRLACLNGSWADFFEC